MDAQKYVGNKIKSLRIQHKMSQTELAKRLGVSDSIISGYERGTRTPSVDVLINLKNIFNVSLDYFFNDEIEQNARLTVDLTDLTDEQFIIVAKLIDEFSKLNKERNMENE